MNFEDGVYTVLVTPFDDQNYIDYDSLENLIEIQCKSKSDRVNSSWYY